MRKTYKLLKHLKGREHLRDFSLIGMKILKY
jgi:hypothetical protein